MLRLHRDREVRFRLHVDERAHAAAGDLRPALGRRIDRERRLVRVVERGLGVALEPIQLELLRQFAGEVRATDQLGGDHVAGLGERRSWRMRRSPGSSPGCHAQLRRDRRVGARQLRADDQLVAEHRRRLWALLHVGRGGRDLACAVRKRIVGRPARRASRAPCRRLSGTTRALAQAIALAPAPPFGPWTQPARATSLLPACARHSSASGNAPSAMRGRQSRAPCARFVIAASSPSGESSALTTLAASVGNAGSIELNVTV